MVNLNELSTPALKAAMKGGTAAWGEIGSASEHVRYAEPLTPKSRKICYCGCDGKRTHRGMANGVCLTTACHMGILRWVKTGSVKATRSEHDKFAVGDYVTREGSDVQLVTFVTEDGSCGEFKCVVEPASGWCHLGDVEFNLCRRYKRTTYSPK